ncbi:hypothetical protein KFK09_001447 [Dendrobium nobile]|uniref:Retrovirus-related Pol polyprotein from transposon TNT 1-94 n=1 Tax=Dendrobium nobile TaxID=94219 RepID=A0A8T3C558_DENNO|nr:hypothetical protein KFK09_001447 [Dendrobium nobile]
MKDHNMQYYLTELKQKIDTIRAAGCSIDPEDIILYTLNGLPSAYNAFKTAIRTRAKLVDLDELYSLLCTEEVNVLAEQLTDITSSTATADSSFALTAVRGRVRGRGRGRTFSTRGSRSPNITGRGGGRRSLPHIECQICLKPGHSASNCWHRGNFSYQPQQPQALISYASRSTSS